MNCFRVFSKYLNIMDVTRVDYGGITDINTAKAIAKKLFHTYSHGDIMDKRAMEKMLVDTYKVMVRPELR